MSLLDITLFGRFRVMCQDQVITGLDIQKVQELLSYLFLNRYKPISRELLAGLLWGDSSSAQSKRYLRQSLWQLKAALDTQLKNQVHQLLRTDSNFIFLNPDFDLRLDVAMFEQYYSLVKGVPIKEVDEQKFRSIQDAVQLYTGDLLEGWYQDWCLFERERLQNMLILMLDKLMGYCEVHHWLEEGILYGASILKYDQARERTHQGLMRLLYSSGDRTGALRQYERCVEILEAELGVKPSKETILLHQQILNDSADNLARNAGEVEKVVHPIQAAPHKVLNYLRKFKTTLDDFQRQLEQEIRSIEGDLDGK